MKQVVLVEPDRQFAHLVKSALQKEGYGVAVTQGAQDTIDWLDRPNASCDALILELALGAHSGVEVLHELRSHADWIGIPVIVHSRVPRPSRVGDAVLQQQYGIAGFIQKGGGSLGLLQRELARVLL